MRSTLPFPALGLRVLVAAALGVILLPPPAAAQSPTGVPRQVPFIGTLADADGSPITHQWPVVFAIYAEAEGGAPLWVETQLVTPDAQGRYQVQLGSQGDGLPQNLFASTEARWLGIQPDGQAEAARVRLLSVPYALKAGDAETLGGLPVSAFLRAEAGPARPGGSSRGGNDAAAPGLLVVPEVRSMDSPGDAGAANGPPDYNTSLGWSTLLGNTTGVRNLALGGFALFANTEGHSNIAAGDRALASNAGGWMNAAVGVNALYFNSWGARNTGIGFNAMYSNTTGNDNFATGYNALRSNTSGNRNIALGTEALYSNGTGYDNLATGYRALYINSSGHDNIASGYQAMYANQTGHDNVASGYQALYANLDGHDNIGTGRRALHFNTTGDANVATGALALYSNVGGNSNVATGYQALFANSSGFQNVAIGYDALFVNQSGNRNVALGAYAGSNATGSDGIYIGNSGVAGESGAIYLGSSGTHTKTVLAGNVGIGTSNPGARLEVAGSIDTTNGGNRRLTLRSASNYNYALQATGDDFQILEAGGTPRVHVDYPGGRVGINTTAPAYQLDVAGDVGVRGNIETTNGGNRSLTLRSMSNYNYVLQATGDDFQILEAGVTPRFHIDYPGGRIGIGTTSPTHPLEMASGAYVSDAGEWVSVSTRAAKTNVAPLSADEAAAALADLTPVTFVYKAAPDDPKVGFIAEDVPALVATPDRKSLSPMDIVAVLTRVVQRQEQRIQELERQLQALGAARQGPGAPR